MRAGADPAGPAMRLAVGLAKGSTPEVAAATAIASGGACEWVGQTGSCGVRRGDSRGPGGCSNRRGKKRGLGIRRGWVEIGRES
eukprot:365835-Chlamydomonas_euryale.AAC.2